MRFIAHIIEKLQRHPKRVVFPEGTEPRVLQAARQFYSLRLGAPILLGDRTAVKNAAAELNVSLEGVRIINPSESEDLPAFIKRYEYLRRYKGGVEEKEARETMLNPNYYGAMMLAMHQVDGFISGANQSSGSVLRPLFQIVKVAPEATTASSCMVMEVEDTRFGTDGTLFMADCGVIPEPTVQQLADIAVSTADLCSSTHGGPASRGIVVVFDEGQRHASVHRQSPGGHSPRPKDGARQRLWRRISTASFKWMPRWSPKSPRANCRKARSRAAPTF